MADIPLSQFKPRSELVVAQHSVPRPKFPVIDFHAHLFNPSGYNLTEAMVQLEAYGIIGLVNLHGSRANRLDEVMAATSGKSRRIATFAGLDVTRLDDPGFPGFAAKSIKDAHAKGARGLKFFKELSLGHKDSRGQYIPVDTPRLRPIWDTAAELDMPVLIHIADPIAFFRPIDGQNERIEELGQNPRWSFSGAEFFSFEQLMEMQDNLLASNADTTFVVAHVGSASEDLSFVSAQLKKHQNMYVDIAARISELGRQPYSSRRFFVEHSDRILFGTDIGDYYIGTGNGGAIYPYYYRFLETWDEYFDYGSDSVQGRWKIYGIGLPDDILAKIYYKNAIKLVPSLAEA